MEKKLSTHGPSSLGAPERAEARQVPFFHLVLLLATLFFLGCSPQKEKYSPLYAEAPVEEMTVYVFGPHPLHSPEKLFEVYQPLVDLINKRLEDGSRIRLEASRNYGAYEDKLYQQQFDFAMPNPLQTVKSLDHGYHVFAKMGDDENFCGVILVRKDSGIEQVADLKGKAVCYPSSTALAACMMPQMFLQENGIDVSHEIENRYVGSQESSILNVLRGNVAAGCTWPLPWLAFQRQHPEMATALDLRWRTASLINNGFVVREGVPRSVVTAFTEVLLGLHLDEEGRAILSAMELSRMETATDGDYRMISDYVTRFEQKVRKLADVNP